MTARQFLKGTIREDQLHFIYEVSLLILSAEVIDDEKPSPEEIFGHPSGFILGQGDIADFTQIGDRIFETIVCLEGRDMPPWIHVQLGQLRHNFHKMLFRPGPVMTPRRSIPFSERSHEFRQHRKVKKDPSHGEFAFLAREFRYVHLRGKSQDSESKNCQTGSKQPFTIYD